MEESLRRIIRKPKASPRGGSTILHFDGLDGEVKSDHLGWSGVRPLTCLRAAAWSFLLTGQHANLAHMCITSDYLTPDTHMLYRQRASQQAQSNAVQSTCYPIRILTTVTTEF